MDDHPRPASRARARASTACSAWFGVEPVPLLFSSFAVLVCLVYVHLPFMVLPLYANLEKHDQALLDAAQDLGANAWQRFWRITFPLSLPGVYAGAALVFIPALGIFAIPDILGGPDDSLIGNVIKQQFLETRDWPFGSVLSIVLTVAALALAGLAAWIGRRSARRRASAGACVGARSGCGPRRCVALRVPVRAARRSSSSTRSTIRASTPNGSASRSTGTASCSHNDEMLRGRRQFAADRARRRASCRRCSARWPAWRCTATSCGCCRSSC